MGSDNETPDPVPIDALVVVRVIDDIDETDDEHRDALLCDFMCAAWGSVVGQNQ